MSDHRRTPDITLHKGAVIAVCRKMKRRGAMNRWTLVEAVDHGLAEGFEALDRYYSPDRGNVSTFLYRVLPQRLIQLYLTEQGLGTKGTKPECISLEADGRLDCHTPLDTMLDEEAADRVRRDAHDVMAEMVERSTGRLLAAWVRAGRKNGALSLGVPGHVVGTAVTEYRTDMGLERTSVYWHGV